MEHVRRTLWQALIIKIGETIIDGREYTVYINPIQYKDDEMVLVEALVTLLNPGDAEMGEIVSDVNMRTQGETTVFSLFIEPGVIEQRTFQRIDEKQWKRIK